MAFHGPEALDHLERCRRRLLLLIDQDIVEDLQVRFKTGRPLILGSPADDLRQVRQVDIKAILGLSQVLQNCLLSVG